MRKVEYIVDSFIDYAGLERMFVMAAVSIHDETYIDIKEDFTGIGNDMKVLSIGVSVCRPNDEFDETLGKRIAEGKAIKRREHALYVTDAGLINQPMVQALLRQEADYFKINPGRYLVGYDKDMHNWKKSEAIEDYIENLDEKGRIAFDYLTDASAEEVNRMVDAMNYVMA